MNDSIGHCRIAENLAALEAYGVGSWQDLAAVFEGLKARHLDSILHGAPVTIDKFFKKIGRSISVVSYRLAPDSLGNELVKTAWALRKVLQSPTGPPATIHWVGGRILPHTPHIKGHCNKFYQVPGFGGFEQWQDPYHILFGTKLERNHEAYKTLPQKIWKQALQLASRLADCFDETKTELIIAADVVSLPISIASTLAFILVAELGRYPVICLNGSFFWEQSCPVDHSARSVHFDRNRHLPEVFSVLESIYPWDSPLWIHANTSETQSVYLKEKKGINPARTHTLPTVVNTDLFHPSAHTNTADIYKKLNRMFLSQEKKIQVRAANIFNPARYLERAPLILGAKNDLNIMFSTKTLLLLQPTRMIPARRVEQDLHLLLEFSHQEALKVLFKENRYSNVVLLITGRVGMGFELYFEDFIQKTSKTFANMDPSVSNRFFVGFLFGELVSDASDEKPDPSSVTLSEMYSISDLVLLPSETEGRALPVREAAASGVPVLSSHFAPEAVYRQVIGPPDEPQTQLQVITLHPGKTESAAKQALTLLCDREKREALSTHNLKVAKQRFSRNVLVPAWRQIISDLWILSQANTKVLARAAMEALIDADSKQSWKTATNTRTRKYLPGFCQLGYISTTKGLMEPSGYLAEERALRERLFNFAQSLIRHHPVERTKCIQFMMATEALFALPGRAEKTTSDHALSFHRRSFPKRLHEDLTEQQLMGAVGKLVNDVFGDSFDPRSGDPGEYWETSRDLWSGLSFHADTWVKRLRLLSSLGALNAEEHPLNNTHRLKKQILSSMSQLLAIDDASIFLQEVVHKPRHLLHFTGSWKNLFFELLILGLHLLEHWRAVTARTGGDYSITFAARKTSLGDRTTIQDLRELLETSPFGPIKKAFEENRFRFMTIHSMSMGTDLGQLGDKNLEILKQLRKQAGIVTASGDHNAHTLDLLDLPCFRFGCITESPAAHLTGIPKGSSYLQFVPRRTRPTLGFPFSVQTGKDFSNILSSPSFRTLGCIEGSTERAWNLLETHAEQTAAPAENVLSQRFDSKENHPSIEYRCGLHNDGLPYTSVTARLEPIRGKKGFSFVLQNTRHGSESVLDIALRHEGETGEKTAAAWSGGYMINELIIHRLGLPQDLLGTPLGLHMINGRVLAPPLFNRPSLAFDKKGRPHISRLKLDFAGSINTKNPNAPRIAWQKSAINPETAPHDAPAVYTLMHTKSRISIEDRAVLVLAGNYVAQIILPDETVSKETEIKPIGLHVSIPLDMYYEELADTYFEGTEVIYNFSWPPFWRDMVNAVEAGPLLLKNNRIAVELRSEGWKTHNSLLTQTARIDIDTLRGPKLGVGLTRDGAMLVTAVNGRIRDSVGATYKELARLLKEQGAFSAMCFDSGGGVTLVTNQVVRNIPPYCTDADSNPVTAQPEPRPVGGAILATLPSKRS